MVSPAQLLYRRVVIKYLLAELFNKFKHHQIDRTQEIQINT